MLALSDDHGTSGRVDPECAVAVVESARDAIISVGSDGRVTSWNPAADRMFGYSAVDILGRPLATLIPERFRVAHRAGFQRFFAAGHGRIIDEVSKIRGMRRDGNEFPAELSLAAWRRGETLFCTAIVREATVEPVAADERASMEDAIRVSEARYRVLFDGSPLPIVVFDPATLAIMAVNDAVVRLYGYSLDELMQMKVSDLNVPEVAAAPTHEIGESRQSNPSGSAWRGTRKHRTKNGRLLDVEIAAHVVVLDGRSAVLTIERDITERRAMEEQLRHAQKMEAVGRLAGGIAHDFNNILAVIASYAGLLEVDLGADHSSSADVREIRSAAQRAAQLTQHLLSFSRRQPAHPRLLKLNATIAAMRNMLARVSGEDVRLSISLDPNLASIEADPAHIEQVLLNLVVNARDAMRTGGELTIETRNTTADETHSPELGVPRGEYVLLSVHDTGLGMDEATRARVFEPFFTTKPVGKGTGLGLATVFGIVQQAGGAVSFDSEVGRGTTFRILLPVAVEPTQRSQPPAPYHGERGSELIMIVDDDEKVRAVAGRVLTAKGYRVIAAEDPADALRLLADGGAKVQLLLTDLIMPSMSGSELAERARSNRPSLRVLFMSGYRGHPSGAVVALGPAEHFIRKPFDMVTLAAAVREAIDGVAPPERPGDSGEW